jgi:hypothetical protein
MGNEFFHELIALARGTAAAFREAECKLATVTAELARREHEVQLVERAPATRIAVPRR